MTEIYKQRQGAHRRAGTIYFKKVLKERVLVTRAEAEAMEERGAAVIRKMRPGNRKTGPRSKSLLLPKRYKSEAAAQEGAEEVARTTPFSDCMRFEPVRCVGTLPDKKPEVLDGRYNWRLRRSFI